ncbi:MAG: chain-length determining protein [Prevotellaceae bacterium]|jgi:uncharacterized protein involved in exopolysaccharide biosynthesis|nr:chain-length determining protein [Prevotellaceae bacterium]
METFNNNMPKQNGDDNEQIDLRAILQKIKKYKRFLIKAGIIGFVAGIVVAFSIPKEYTTEVILAQSTGSSGKGGLGALASMAGIDLLQQSDAELSPVLYPDISSSTPFLKGLFDIRLKDEEEEIDTTVYDYLRNCQKTPWWSYVMGLPSIVTGMFRSTDNEKITAVKNDASSSSVVVLSKAERGVIGSLKSRIEISVDKKTGVTTISVTMQNPIVSATIADTVISYMQDYIISYRTAKAQKNLEYIEKLYNEAQEEYFKKQQAFAKASDENISVVSAKYRIALTRYENEMNLAYGVYNQTAQQLQLARIKVQDTKPVCVIIQPAVVPSTPAKPKKKIIMAGFIFLALAGAGGWIYLKETLLNDGNKKENQSNDEE